MVMRVSVIAHPGARQPRIEEDLLGRLHVYVNQPALEGKANRAVLEALARHYGVAKSRVTLVSGERGKNKVVEVG
jgi:uncharacterized protein YggU (UPF0235/DUF167 family)